MWPELDNHRNEKEMNNTIKIPGICLILLALFSCGGGQSPPASSAGAAKVEILKEPIIAFNPKKYISYRADKPLKIDGDLKDAQWANAPWTDKFQDIEGPSLPQPRFATRVKMLWDDLYFYFAAEMEEPDVWAKLKKRDAVIYYDNDFEIFIDPDGDTYDYYEFEINAFGTEWDLFLPRPYRDGGPAYNAWDIQGLKSAVAIQGTLNKPGDRDTGWTVEVAIPWAVLKEGAPGSRKPKAGEQWRVNFSRVEWQTEVINGQYEKIKDSKSGASLPENNWVWSPQGVINLHYPEMWGFVQFSDKNGSGEKDTFVEKDVEKAKYALRKIYYRQRSFLAGNDFYAQDVAALQLAGEKVPGYKWPPILETTSGSYRASLAREDGSGFVVIDQTGRVRER